MYTYPEAINKALINLTNYNNKTLIIGQGVSGEKAIFDTTRNIPKENLLDFPICEETMTGFGIGLAINGYKPILSHIRLDFMASSMNQIINMGDKYRQMFGNKYKIPLIIRGIIGRSWGQGAQHSQGFYPIFCHFPNLFVYAPVTANDAYHCLINNSNNDNPTIIIEHRKLYNSSLTSSEIKNIDAPITKSFSSFHNPDLTLVGISRSVIDCYKIIPFFNKLGINIDVLYPVQLNPLNIYEIEESVKKSKNILIVENSWTNCGISAEIMARLPSNINKNRMGFNPSSCPASSYLENLYYPDAINIAKKILNIFNIKREIKEELFLKENIKSTKGPF